MHHNSNAMTSVKGNRASELRKHGGKGTYKQREMTKLDIDNKQMEWRLHQLKQTMEEEKKGRSQVGNIWESASTRALNIPTKVPIKANLNSKTGKVRPKTEGNRKIIVLKDEPIEMPKRKSNYTTLIEKLSKEDQSLEQYTSNPGTVEQSESKQAWIPMAKNRNSEEILDIQSDPDGNLPLSSIKTINPNAIGLFFVKWGRKRILPAVDEKVVRPKAGWGTDTYYPYVSAINWQQQQKTPAVNFNLKNKPQVPKTPESPRPQKKTSQEVESPRTGGMLFQGEFNEEDSAESFQRALQQWRKDSKPTGTPGAGAEKKEMSVHSVQSDPIEIQVNFSETSTLTANEKQILEKHRASSIPPLTTLTSDLQRGDYLDDDLDIFHELSAEVVEERERIRDIFSSSLIPKSYLGGVTSSIYFTEVNDDEPVADGQTSKCIVEVPNENKEQVDSRPSSRVTIQEFDYSRESKPEEERTDTEMPTQAGSNQIFKCKNENSRSLLSAVSSLSIDPKAVYNHRNLGNFFTGGEDSTNSPRQIQEDNEEAPVSKMMTKTHSNAQSWQPSTSIVSSLRERKIERLDSFEADSFEAHDFEEKQSYKLEEIKTLEDIEKVIEREKDDQEHLKKLEWELASQTGNINKEGSISRLIDEWPSDDDDSKLGIINDPGTSSGLTTPDVDRFKWADHLPVVGPSSPAADEDVTIRKPWSSPGNARFQHIENYMISGIDESDDEL